MLKTLKKADEQQYSKNGVFYFMQWRLLGYLVTVPHNRAKHKSNPGL